MRVSAFLYIFITPFLHSFQFDRRKRFKLTNCIYQRFVFNMNTAVHYASDSLSTNDSDIITNIPYRFFYFNQLQAQIIVSEYRQYFATAKKPERDKGTRIKFRLIETQSFYTILISIQLERGDNLQSMR